MSRTKCSPACSRACDAQFPIHLCPQTSSVFSDLCPLVSAGLETDLLHLPLASPLLCCHRFFFPCKVLFLVDTLHSAVFLELLSGQ